jgi:hypothetical protein
LGEWEGRTGTSKRKSEGGKEKEGSSTKKALRLSRARKPFLLFPDSLPTSSLALSGAAGSTSTKRQDAKLRGLQERGEKKREKRRRRGSAMEINVYGQEGIKMRAVVLLESA